MYCKWYAKVYIIEFVCTYCKYQIALLAPVPVCFSTKFEDFTVSKREHYFSGMFCLAFGIAVGFLYRRQ